MPAISQLFPRSPYSGTQDSVEPGAAGPHPRLARASLGTPSPNLGRGGGTHEVGGGEGLQGLASTLSCTPL
jgi:hypothetical protein